MRYWRQIPEPERSELLREAAGFFEQFLALPQLRKKMAGATFELLRRQAESDLVSKFDIPPNFSTRAREGLLASLVLAAATEQKTGEPYPDQQLADFHALLLKER